MINFPNNYIAEEFSFLMQEPLHNNHQSNEFVFRYIANHGSFHALVINSFQDVDKEKRIDFLMKNLGWVNFRDRLASVYLYYCYEGKFPNETQLSLVKDLIAFEASLGDHIVSGSSRTFMLAFYLEMARIELEKKHGKEAVRNFHIPHEVIELVPLMKKKSFKLDWVLIYLWHLYEFLGAEVEDVLKNSEVTLKSVSQILDQSQLDMLYANLITYAYCINDDEFFQEEVN